MLRIKPMESLSEHAIYMLHACSKKEVSKNCKNIEGNLILVPFDNILGQSFASSTSKLDCQILDG